MCLNSSKEPQAAIRAFRYDYERRLLIPPCPHGSTGDANPVCLLLQIAVNTEENSRAHFKGIDGVCEGKRTLEALIQTLVAAAADMAEKNVLQHVRST